MSLPGGICIEVGAIALPKVFGIAFNSDGTVIRVCCTAWRRGDLIGASYLSANQLRSKNVPAKDHSPKPSASRRVELRANHP
jgi:hypothetical protein